ncbi:MAG: hypothetical protein KIT16_19555 [Rhodospirillaceae bacterium]|nr:hypothetical protein [Rhodospirillaceae bacterium]
MDEPRRPLRAFFERVWRSLPARNGQRPESPPQKGDLPAQRPDPTPLDGQTDWRSDFARTVAAARERVAAIRQGIEARHRAAIGFCDEGPGPALDVTGNLALLAAAGRGVSVVIHGIHTPDWMAALEPAAPVWRHLPGVTRVSLAASDPEPNLAEDMAAGLLPIVIPLMEPHIRALKPDQPALRPHAEALELLSDKLLFDLYAERFIGKDMAPHYASLETLRYPCIVKSARLNGGQGIAVARTPADLAAAMTEPGWLGMPKTIQAYVPGRREYVTHAVCQSGAVLWHATYRYDMPPDVAVRGPGAHLAIRRRQTTRKALGFIRRLAADLLYDGPLNLDYRLEGGILQVFEVNPRLGGSLMMPEHLDDLAGALRAIINGALVNPLAGIVRRSPRFDADFYAATHPALAGNADLLARHYLLCGGFEGRDPGPAFSSRDYRALNGAAVPAQANPLLHYELEGRARNLPVAAPGRRHLAQAALRLSGRAAGSAEDGMRVVTGREAMRLIADNGLRAPGDIRHYSWDLERFHDTVLVSETPERLAIFATRGRQYASTPLPLFAGPKPPARVMAERGRQFPFWYLRLDSFEAFLARRSALSAAPHKHFPTNQTWDGAAIDARFALHRQPLCGNEASFAAHFTRLKNPRTGFDGKACLDYYFGERRRAPKDWFFVHLLEDRATADIVAVRLTIEQGEAATFLNLAAAKGQVRLLVALTVRDLCQRGFKALDGGVSGYFGSYKSAFFLDSLEADATGYPPLD